MAVTHHLSKLITEEAALRALHPPPSLHHSLVRAMGSQRFEHILADMKMVAEGVKSSSSVVALAAQHGVEMPICEQITAVCHRGKTAAEGLSALMSRESKSELAGLDD